VNYKIQIDVRSYYFCGDDRDHSDRHHFCGSGFLFRCNRLILNPFLKLNSFITDD